MGQTTITVQDKTLQRFKQLKQELDDVQNAPDHSADSFLKALMDTWDAVEDGYYGEPSDPLTFSEVDEIANQLVEGVESMNVQLEATERRKIAREVAEELR